MDDILKTVKEVIAGVLQVEAEKIPDDVDVYLEYGMDSLTAVKALAILDERLGIQIPDENLEKIKTPKDMAKLIQECLEKRAK
jgi:acyl carrier protein